MNLCAVDCTFGWLCFCVDKPVVYASKIFSVWRKNMEKWNGVLCTAALRTTCAWLTAVIHNCLKNELAIECIDFVRWTVWLSHCWHETWVIYMTTDSCNVNGCFKQVRFWTFEYPIKLCPLVTWLTCIRCWARFTSLVRLLTLSVLESDFYESRLPTLGTTLASFWRNGFSWGTSKTAFCVRLHMWCETKVYSWNV